MFGKKHDEELDQVISEIRGEEISAPALESAARRVWQRLHAEDVAIGSSDVAPGCGAIRADLPLLKRGELSRARQLIVEDHLRECASCRAYAAGSPDPVATASNWRIEPSRAASRGSFARYGWAAAAVVLLAAAGLIVGERYLAGPAGSRAQIESVAGHAYLVSATNESPLKAGDQIGQDEMIRTASDSRAVLRLLDGSRVEMNQRTEFSVSAGFRNTSIRLNQGDIIVEAPRRRTGHLYVSTPDCTVSDKGTIFAIESGTKGSRVGVIEGTVSVAHDGTESVLHAGESVATAQSVGAVPVSGQIGWSADREHYLALLDEFSRLRHRFADIPSPARRYQSRILPMVPADTVLYVSVPNLGNMFAQGDRIFRDELDRSPVLREWWNHVTTPQNDAALEQVIGKIETGSQYLGDEMVLVGSLEGKDGPVLLAPVKNPGLGEFLRQQVASIGGASGPFLPVVDEKSLRSLAPTQRGFIALVRHDMLMVGSASAVRRMNAAFESGPSGFENTDFGKQVLGVYNQGAQVLFGADLERIMAQVERKQYAKNGPKAAQGESSVLENLGFGDMKYLIATHGDTSGQTENRAVLGFADERRGLASWLAAPSPMGSLGFVSSDAGAAVSVITKQPAEMFDDVVRLAQAHNQTNVNEELAQKEAQIGLDFRNNLAGALGGEMTFALDGPVLPTPSWKLIVEVNEPVVLQNSIAKLVELADEGPVRSKNPVVTLEQDKSGGRMFYTIAFPQARGLTEIDYTYADGYLVAGSSRAMVMNSLEVHANGDSLAASNSFHALLPRDSHTNFSALMYWNLGPVVRPLAAQFGSADQGQLQHLAANAKPSAVCAYGGTNTIEVASTASLLDLQPDAISLLSLIHPGSRGTSRAPNP
jgi:FecR protein